MTRRAPNRGSSPYTPAADFCGADTFTYTVGDGAATDEGSVTVTVNCGNDPPAAVDDTPSTPEDTPADIAVLANDTDPDGDTLSLSSVTDAPHGSVAIQAGGIVRYTPDADYCGPDSFTYTAGDGHGASDTATVAVTVGCVNDAPVLAPIAVRSAPWGSAVTFTASASDADPGDVLSFSLVDAPAGASISSGGAFSWTPAAVDIGDHTFSVAVDDGEETVGDEVRITVTAAPSTITFDGPNAGTYSDPLTVSATLTDAGGSPVGGKLVYFSVGSAATSATTDPSGVATATITPENTPGSWTASASFAGDAEYGAANTSEAFVIAKESATVAFNAARLTTTSSTSAPAPMAATIVEDGDESLGTELGSVQVTFRQVGGAVLCSAVAAAGPTPGTATATCTAPNLALGSRGVIVAINSAHYAGPVDVVVSTVGSTAAGSSSGAGRIGSDDFGFSVSTPRKGAPAGDAIHVFRVGGTAFMVRSTAITSRTASCAGGKTKVCSTTVQASAATTTQIDLATGTVGSATGSSTLRLDATDKAEPVNGSVPPDTYAVSITGSTTHTLGSSAAQVPIGAGNVRVVP